MIRILSDGVLEQIADHASDAPRWIPQEMGRHVRRLGPKAVRRMRDAVHPNRYTGALEDSIGDHYSNNNLRAEIYPSAQRGRWDAGVILELGTRPIPRAPYWPIAAWAFVKGAPMPGAWLKIRMRGVSAHPFLDRTMDAFIPDLDRGVMDMAESIAVRLLWGAGKP